MLLFFTNSAAPFPSHSLQLPAQTEDGPAPCDPGHNFVYLAERKELLEKVRLRARGAAAAVRRC